MIKNLGIAVNFCSNESLFLKSCIDAALKVSQEVIVAVADHFFDGTPENKSLLTQAFLENPYAQFLEFAYEPEKNFYGSHPISFWHNWGRLLCCHHFTKSIDWVLFLDADEILDSEAFIEWFGNKKHADAERLSSYWYFREPKFRAKHWEDGILLAKKQKLTNTNLMHHLERIGTYFSLGGTKARHLTGINGLPMFHHYSWVRSKEEMLRKVKTWGHRTDAPWQELVEKEFSHSFSGKDFVYGDNFDVLTNPIHIFSKTCSSSHTIPKNVRFLSTQEMHKIELLC